MMRLSIKILDQIQFWGVRWLHKRKRGGKKYPFLIIFWKHFPYLHLIYRRSKLHPQKQRSKYICKPEAVIEAGNHFVWEYIPGKGALNVPADSAILHHYRVSTTFLINYSTKIQHIPPCLYLLQPGLWIWWWWLCEITITCRPYCTQVLWPVGETCRCNLWLSERTVQSSRPSATTDTAYHS